MDRSRKIAYVSQRIFPNKAFNIVASSVESNSNLRNKEKEIVSKNDDSYSMDFPENGLCLIFNQHLFKSTTLEERTGTNIDRDNLCDRFRLLGFDVVVHNDLTVNAIIAELKWASELDHSNRYCLVVIFTSHGGKNGVLYAHDGKFDATELFKKFTADKCPSLANKPKLFFIQACRGEQKDFSTLVMKTEEKSTNDVATDGATDGAKAFSIPNHSDFFFFWSTVDGFASFRDFSKGSWFFQAIVQTIPEEKTGDLFSIVLAVNRKIQEFRELSKCKEEWKQTPCFSSTLTKKVFLKPKSQWSVNYRCPVANTDITTSEAVIVIRTLTKVMESDTGTIVALRKANEEKDKQNSYLERQVESKSYANDFFWSHCKSKFNY